MENQIEWDIDEPTTQRVEDVSCKEGQVKTDLNDTYPPECKKHPRENVYYGRNNTFCTKCLRYLIVDGESAKIIAVKQLPQ